jgi:hypothetical protein
VNLEQVRRAWRFHSTMLDEIVTLVDERLAKNRAAGAEERR